MDVFNLIGAELTAEAFVEQRLLSARSVGSDRQHFALQVCHLAQYLQPPTQTELIVLVSAEFRAEASAWDVQFGLVPVSRFNAADLFTAPSSAQLSPAESSRDNYKNLIRRYMGLWLDFSKPLVLEPIEIPKPWGREIWYTGIEARGQSRVTDGLYSAPLPWLVDLFPKYLGSDKTPILLKVLDPFPEPVKGDLYFELHEQKQEVYVVTHIDPCAWPDASGQIQMGFNQLVRASYGDDEAFKADYLAAVQRYREVRQLLDGETQSVIATDESTELVSLEIERRQQMNRFVAARQLQVGDVVCVPCLVPHSLQHGVRVIEFQTPVYERKILSFGQKVLTQSHWDTEAALTMVKLDIPEAPAFRKLALRHDLVLEVVAEFDDFEVQRLTCYGKTGALVNWSEALDSYLLVNLIRGQVTCAGHQGRAGEAWLVPQVQGRMQLEMSADAILLLARPK